MLVAIKFDALPLKITISVILLLSICSSWFSSLSLEAVCDQGSKFGCLFQLDLPFISIPSDRDDTTNEGRAVFYNVYVHSAERVAPTMNIVKEQLAVLKNSSVWNSVKLYYNVIGYNATDVVQQECGNQCHFIKFVPQGDESITLQSLHDYCQEHPAALVTYIHDKGSHTPMVLNEILRRWLTDVVSSDECQTIGMANNTCNLCGGRFWPFPHHHLPGNMWTAQCSYIRRLSRPDQFQQKMENLVQDVFNNAVDDPSIPKPTIGQYNDGWFIGTSRYALEHWVGSHPSVRPCDLYSRADYFFGYANIPEASHMWIPDLLPAPRYKASSNTGFLSYAAGGGNWQCGKGRLLEYRYLYGELPPKDSFVWSFYAEPYGRCEPLDYEQHNSFYADLSTVFVNITKIQ